MAATKTKQISGERSKVENGRDTWLVYFCLRPVCFGDMLGETGTLCLITATGRSAKLRAFRLLALAKWFPRFLTAVIELAF